MPPSECEANKQPHPDLDEGMNCADRRHALVERVVVETLKRDRAVLCRPVADLTDPQPTLATTRHSLTFRVRVATPARYGRNGTASLQITSHTQQTRRFYRWCVRACLVRAECGGPGGLPLGSATHF